MLNSLSRSNQHAQLVLKLKVTFSGPRLIPNNSFFFAMLRSLFALFHFLAFFFSRQSKKPLKTIHLTFAHKKQRVNNRWYLCCLQFPCVVVVVCFLFGWCVDFFVCVYSTTIGLLVLKCWLMLVRITLLNSTKEGHCFLLLFPSNRWSSF